jgi:thiol-disulfide isomerase/thioredoxin
MAPKMLKKGDTAPGQQTGFLVFYKFSCPICQFIFPFLQKIFEAYGDVFRFTAIAQDPAEKVDAFNETYGVRIPTILDLPPYHLSNAYGIEVVPSIFIVNEDHRIELAFESFDKKQIEKSIELLAQRTGRSPIDVFHGQSVPELRPG